jgi:hypothetical protein
LFSFLVGDTNNTTGRSGTSVTSLERLLGVALAKVVGTGVDNNGSTNDAVGSNKLDQRVSDRALGIALTISLHVSKVTDMTGLVRRSTMGLVVRVEVRASGGAAVGVVTEGVDVESSLGVGIVASDVPGDGSRGRLGLLLEDDGTGDLGVTSENAHYKSLY